ncbi:hypothetical protein AGRA3207_000204 [Actinomadura graeca]|uniref:Transcriptional regulator n=1 Tax=Actinomadura graeca TaxID=2750812 RepID=A0ABX8QLV9_9ACTN|nr:hypothetical protein [Actinomadura graeca]QXJ19641.1 hypothetical protein AGRA3207_000204 [Actinomadura graeca]
MAIVNDLTVDGPWVGANKAGRMTGIRLYSLAYWQDQGIISVFQTSGGSSRRYLEPEMKVLAALGADGPPTLYNVRDYLRGRTGNGEGGAGSDAKAAKNAEMDTTPDLAEPDVSQGAEFTHTLASLLRGQKIVAERIESLRVRADAEAGARGVTIECRRRPDDADRWWFTWGGGVWMCEADKPNDAVVQVKAALRTVGPPR